MLHLRFQIKNDSTSDKFVNRPIIRGISIFNSKRYSLFSNHGKAKSRNYMSTIETPEIRTKISSRINAVSLLKKSELYDRKFIPEYLVTFLVLLFDLVGFFVCLGAAHTIRNNFNTELFLSFNAICLFLVLFFFLYVFDLYNLESQIAGLRPPGRVLIAALLAGITVIPIFYLSGGGRSLTNTAGRGILAITLGLFAIWGSSSRFFLTKWTRKRAKKLEWLFLTDESVLSEVWKDFKSYQAKGSFKFLVPNLSENYLRPGQIPIYSGWNSLEGLLKQPWSGVVVEDNARMPEHFGKMLMNSRIHGQRIMDLSEFYENILYKIPLYYIKDGWITMAHGFDLLHNPIGLRVKRVFDFIFSILLLTVTSPLILLTGLLVKLTSRGPIIYKQVRTGEGNKSFVIYKFRSMIAEAEKNGAQWALANDERITQFGRFMRKTRLDELPQLWNVLRGEMSFIGPRPERPEMNAFLEKEIPYYNLRHLVKPGVSGWAQVLYSYGSSVEDAREKLQYELFYIKNYSLLLDFAIVLKTMRVVLFGRGQ
jgi:exopolysaccharide biosynthesis polyprenyl glycosylphosphotransferase